MIKMKALVILSAVFFIANVAAKGDIETKKQRLADNTDKRITILQTFKTCVLGSNTREAIKTCKKNKKDAMKALKASD